jgi:hypothetical protein
MHMHAKKRKQDFEFKALKKHYIILVSNDIFSSYKGFAIVAVKYKFFQT